MKILKIFLILGPCTGLGAGATEGNITSVGAITDMLEYSGILSSKYSTTPLDTSIISTYLNGSFWNATTSTETTFNPFWNGTTEAPYIQFWNRTTSVQFWNRTTNVQSWNRTTYVPFWNRTTSIPSWNSTTYLPSWNRTTYIPFWNRTTCAPLWNKTTRTSCWNKTRTPTSGTTTTSHLRVSSLARGNTTVLTTGTTSVTATTQTELEGSE